MISVGLIRGSAACAETLLSVPCVGVFACGEPFPVSGVERVCANTHTPLASNVTASAAKPKKLAVHAIYRNKPATGPLLIPSHLDNGLGAERGQNMAG